MVCIYKDVYLYINRWIVETVAKMAYVSNENRVYRPNGYFALELT